MELLHFFEEEAQGNHGQRARLSWLFYDIKAAEMGGGALRTVIAIIVIVEQNETVTCLG